MQTGNISEEEKNKILTILDRVTDPEIPVLSVLDLGIVRKIDKERRRNEIFISPTYSACPAMTVISMQIKMELTAGGFSPVFVTEVFSPAWTTDMMSEEGKNKLKDYGIAPPVVAERIQKTLFPSPPVVLCPLCQSENTVLISEFGSTACKSLMKCNDCLEPFDYFKCHR